MKNGKLLQPVTYRSLIYEVQDVSIKSNVNKQVIIASTTNKY
jgi:hypothetical protein